MALHCFIDMDGGGRKWRAEHVLKSINDLVLFVCFAINKLHKLDIYFTF